MSTCLHCGDQLIGRQQFYCCDSHSRRAQHKRRRQIGLNLNWVQEDRPCIGCGSLILDAFPNHKYCKACNIARNAIRVRQQKSCQTCGRDLPKYKSKFCADICRPPPKKPAYVYRYGPRPRRPLSFLLTCSICGNEFAARGPTKLRCSTACEKEYQYQRDKESYVRQNLLERRRKERALTIAAKQVYFDLMGLAQRPTLIVRLATASPIVTIGDWSNYIVLPSRIPQHMSKQKPGLRRTPLVVMPDGFISYVVHRGDSWTPYVNKPNKKVGQTKNTPGSYTGAKSAWRMHYRKRRKRGNKKYYPGNKERRRIRQREDTAILAAFKELNLLPKETLT